MTNNLIQTNSLIHTKGTSGLWLKALDYPNFSASAFVFTRMNVNDAFCVSLIRNFMIAAQLVSSFCSARKYKASTVLVDKVSENLRVFYVFILYM